MRIKEKAKAKEQKGVEDVEIVDLEVAVDVDVAALKEELEVDLKDPEAVLKKEDPEVDMKDLEVE